MGTDEDDAAEIQRIEDRLAFSAGARGFLQAVRARRDHRDHGHPLPHEYVNENED